MKEEYWSKLFRSMPVAFASQSAEFPGDIGSCDLALWTRRPDHWSRRLPDPGRTQTYNPRLRGPMPYPLGHGATCKSLQLCTHSTLLLTRKDLVAELSA